MTGFIGLVGIVLVAATIKVVVYDQMIQDKEMSVEQSVVAIGGTSLWIVSILFTVTAAIIMGVLGAITSD